MYQQNSYQQEGEAAPPAYNPDYTSAAPAQSSAPYTAPAQGITTSKNGDMSQPFAASGGDNWQEDNRFKSGTKCQDCIWIPLFLAQLFTIIGLSAYYYSKNSSSFTTSVNDASFVDSSFWKLCACVILIGIFSAAIWILFIRKFSHCLIWFSLVLTLSMWVVFGILCLALGQYYGLFICIIFALLQLLWMWCVKDRIAFAAAVLEMAVTACNKFGSVYLVSFFSIFVQAIWCLIWIMGFAFVIYDGTKSDDSDDSSDDSSNDTTNSNDSDSSSSSNSVSSGVVFLFLVSFYWTAQVIANVVHVTSAGVVATWYFLFPTKTPSFPVGGALKRSLTTSFGSICFGSFLIAVIQALRAMVRSAQRSNNGFVQCCIQCILACIENILEYFNLYAFTRVAIYGQSYCEAAKETWELFKSKGFDAIINDDLTSTALNFSCIFAGLLAAAVTSLIAHYGLNNDDWYYWAIVAFFIAFGLTLCALVVVRSGVATIFVCFAEDPAALGETKPEYYEKITNAWRQRYGQLPARLTNPQRPV